MADGLEDDFIERLPEPTGNAPETASAATQAGQSGAQATGTLTDARGTVFDPEIHAMKVDGSGPALSRFKNFMRKPGVAATMGDLPRPKSSRAQTSLNLDGINSGGQLNPSQDVPLGPTQEPVEGGEAPISEAERKANAEDDAETIVEIEDDLLNLLGDPLDDRARTVLKASAERGLLRENIQLPFGAWTRHLVRFSREAVSRATTDEGKKRVENFLKILRGEK